MPLLNVIYYENIQRLGGVSTFVYELAQKYHNTKNIVLYYKYGDIEQINRLREYIKVIKWKGEEVKCDNFITNYEHETFIKHLKMSGKGHTYQVIHAMYKTNRVKPKVDDFFDYYVCVSEVVKKEFMELTNLPNEKFIVSHNPLTIMNQDLKPSLVIGVFQRLKFAWEKGGERIKALVDRLDTMPINYLMLVASDDQTIKSNNIAYIKPRVKGHRNIMALCDVVLVLSQCEGDNYTSKEAKSVGCRLICTPVETFYENKVIGEQDKVLEFDMSNIDEVVDWLYNLYLNKEPRQLSYEPIQDKYNEILLNGKSNYRKEEGMKVKVLVNGITDRETGKELPIGFIKEADDSKALETMIDKKMVEVVKEEKVIKEDVVETSVKPKKEVKKAVRKPRRKKADE